MIDLVRQSAGNIQQYIFKIKSDLLRKGLILAITEMRPTAYPLWDLQDDLSRKYRGL